jgi:AraC-like DNA-binding protein
MPGSVTSAFSEPEDFEAALLKEACLSLVVIGSGQFQAQLTQVTLHRLRLSAGNELLSRIAFIAVPDDVVLITFPMGNGTLPVYGGLGMRVGEIMTLSPGVEVHARTDGQGRWGTILVPVEELAEYGRALTGAPFRVPPVAQRWRPSPAAGRELRSLHTAATRIAANRPQLFTNAEAAHGLEQQLIHAIVNCLSAGSADMGRATACRNQNIMARFERLLHVQPPRRDMRIPDICAKLEISERLLRSLCADHLGMGPVHYDRLRRMSLIRRTLLRGGSATPSVATVARDHGFRSAGRFAVNYRAAFGEPPSTTLRRGRDRSTVGRKLN